MKNNGCSIGKHIKYAAVVLLCVGFIFLKVVGRRLTVEEQMQVKERWVELEFPQSCSFQIYATVDCVDGEDP